MLKITFQTNFNFKSTSKFFEIVLSLDKYEPFYLYNYIENAVWQPCRHFVEVSTTATKLRRQRVPRSIRVDPNLQLLRQQIATVNLLCKNFNHDVFYTLDDSSIL